MKEKLEAFKKRPAVAHVLRMVARYGNRLGNQFAGAITYFSVLAMVPILMFAFAVTGMTVTTLFPQMLDQIKNTVSGQLGGAPGNTKEQLLSVIDHALRNWPAIGIFGILSALYAGAGWIANLKSAVRAQWRPDFEREEKKSNIVVETLKNMGTLILLLLMIVLTFGIASAATSRAKLIVKAVGLEGVPGMTFLLRLVSLAVSILTGWLLFLFLYRVLPEERAPKKAWLRGALIGSIGLALLQYLTGTLMGSFTKNPAAAMFGPVIVIMLFFNLFARLILYVASWIATSNQPAVARRYNEADEPLRHDSETNAVDDHWEDAARDQQRVEREKAENAEKQKALVGKVKDIAPGVDPNADEREAMAEERAAKK